MTKHTQEEDKAFVVYQTNEGDFAFVTEDHPIILDNGGEILARDLKIGDAVMDAEHDLPEICENIHVDPKLAYFLGFLLGDGNIEGHETHEDYIDSPVGCVRFTRGGNLITLYQNDIENSKILKIAKEIFPSANMFKFDNDATHRDRCRSFCNWNLSALVSHYFGYEYRENSFTKHLPVNFMQWETDSKLAFVAGLIDSDGTVNKTSGRCSIRLKSYATVNVLFDALNSLGLNGVYKRLSGTNVQDIMFAVDFRSDLRLAKYSEKVEKLDLSLLSNYQANLDTVVRDSKIKNIISFTKKDVNPNSFLYNEIDMVYDITTKTGVFTANGMVQHNCTAIDSMPFIFEGLKNLGCETTAPKHLSSYAGGYYNLISIIASQFAGAVADVGMLKDFYYFAKKDYGENFLDTHRDIVEDRLSQIIYSLNTPAGTRGFQAIFYNTSVFDEFYFKGLYETSLYPDGSKVIDAWEGINKLQKFFLTWFNKEREKALLTFPVITAALKLNDDSSIASDEWKAYVAKEFSEGNSFFVYMDKDVSSLSSCCRLRNDISEQLENTFAYTLGGTGISTGSQNVLTINMNRLVQDGRDLKEQLELMYKYQSAFTEWFHYLKATGMLPVYDAGYIALEKQYLTIGVNGVVEAAEYLGMKINYNSEYVSWLQDILGTMKDNNKQASKYYTNKLGYKVMFNTEFVPAENLGDKFYQWDKRDGYVVPDEEVRNLYNSYFYAVEDKQDRKSVV